MEQSQWGLRNPPSAGRQRGGRGSDHLRGSQRKLPPQKVKSCFELRPAEELTLR